MMVTMSAVPPGEAPGGTVPRAAGQAPDLADLIRSSGLGDEMAFSSLYDATSSRVHGLVLRVVRDPAQAEEVTQEVYLEIWRTSARFDPSLGSPIGWMMTIAHRKAVDRVRSSEASRRRDSTYEAATQETPFDETAERAERRLDRDRVRRALDTLTDSQRGALELAYFGGYTHTEVAAMLGLPLGTAKTRIRDGLIRLRDTLGLES
jgi:RNA polymerase sigma-70 factor, ECF subfamily